MCGRDALLDRPGKDCDWVVVGVRPEDKELWGLPPSERSQVPCSLHAVKRDPGYTQPRIPFHPVRATSWSVSHTAEPEKTVPPYAGYAG